ncbi:hypothetical protein PACTADRAFT_50220 [Pachysolen tannophilus NRRL Y-2460]|uniref:RRM domain-containing protein n=1 Tax=Pachysolen tannophilus NRRL Y-2460 TaxID=669874 RepID=A0A1E4TUQ1_PACTA|nr:hypothetical protein PACTADRAFT_50220 [Pachysolen tannophilus NRRL Y-2460]
MEYATTGMFIVNGYHIQPSWANSNVLNIEDSNYFHQPVPAFLGNEMELNGARRSLILKKQINASRSIRSKTSPKYRHFPSPKSHLSEFDCEETRRIFSKYGEIVDIAPVISRKLCFSVHYFDVRGSISAKIDLETPGSELYNKYSEWTVWYGKDPCDRPCFAL